MRLTRCTLATALVTAMTLTLASAAADKDGLAAGESQAKQLLLLMDADKSGKVSKAEFLRFMEAEFDRLDVNKDGELDVTELKSMPMRAKHTGGAGSK